MATTTVTRARDLRFDAAVRGHIVSTDQPQSAGGADTAPTPLELLDAALGSCIALYLAQFCLSRGLSVDGLLVEVTAERAPGSPKRIGRFVVRVELPAGVPAHLLPAIERVVRTCPVHNTLTSTPEIGLEVWTPDAERVRVAEQERRVFVAQQEQVCLDSDVPPEHPQPKW